MRIQSNPLSVGNIIKNPMQDTQSLRLGQAFTGKILSIEGNVLDILTSSGIHIKAFAQGEDRLPQGTSITFQVVDNTKDILTLKPVFDRVETVPIKENMLIGTVIDLGIKPSPENINFISKGEFAFGKNIERLIKSLEEEGKPEIAEKLKKMMVSPSELEEYLKKFDKDGMGKLVKQLGELFGEIKISETPSRVLENIIGNLLKGLSVQVNHEFPLFYIPVPLNYNGEFYPGEVWIEKDDQGGAAQRASLSIYIFIDSPSMGRIESNIRGNAEYININLKCDEKFVPLFNMYSSNLAQRIYDLGIKVNSINFSKLDKPSSFIDLIEKYVKPFVPVDIKV